MAYYTGMVAAVPTANKHRYTEHAAASWPLFRKHGAVRMTESWGVDTPPGKVTDFQRAVAAKEDETIVFTWIEWPDRAAADAAWQKMETDPDMEAMGEMPFDGSRMIYGGFTPVVAHGQLDGAAYYQGFLLAVPEDQKDAFIKMADASWPEFEKQGALGLAENWGVDVPHGKQTDFYRATKAQDGEAVLFSWIAWPDRATCDAAAKKMEAEMAGQEMPDMPFDGMRMMWGGFETIFDSAKS
ncbi:Uncharacterized conserved protein YbaA, DUF1428 family [Paracoccus isoporae]|uniref:Uncharacterized conserved protein YbaA, DUF1428 family n=1 Tax=Paracoccus isoporae TaxID=591205 RepID=A0A1G6YTM1_9RHOB|nr:DUF1428 domain-containing protein [Paracoccus isoporae]SDD93632.1 Uncharacterized conserved protein YbaA, DUF1428 family [Paracoccus isoporae]